MTVTGKNRPWVCYCALTLLLWSGCSSSTKDADTDAQADLMPVDLQSPPLDIQPETAFGKDSQPELTVGADVIAGDLVLELLSDAVPEVTADIVPDLATNEIEILTEVLEVFPAADAAVWGLDAAEELTVLDLIPEVEISDVTPETPAEDWQQDDLAEVLEDTFPDLTADVVEIPAGLVFVEGGTFWMGSPPTENCGANYEGPQHEVTLTRPLLVMEHEVTYAQWDAVTGAPNPSVFGPEGNNKCGQPDCPVELVNWYEALTFANMLSESEDLEPCYLLTECTGSLGSGCPFGPACEGGYECDDVQFAGLDCEGYRLPTEAEWEYLARAGTSTAYAYPPPDGGAKSEVCGECAAEANLEPHGWYCYNSSGRTHPVKSLEPNSWGLYDMSGNVWEWCWDRFSKNFYSVSPPVDPICETGSSRVTRSGNWSGGAEFARVSERFGDPADFHSLGIGFRLVRTAPQGF